MNWRHFRGAVTDDGHLPLDPDIVSMLGPKVSIVRADDEDVYRGKSDDGIPGSRRYLEVRCASDLAEVCSRMIGRQNPDMDPDPEAKERARELLYNSTDSELDSEGCPMPQVALEHIGIRGGAPVEIFALGDHLEVWNPEDYLAAGRRWYGRD
jgi:hypothetical protein